MQDVSAEIENLKGVVAKYFPVYETRVGPQIVSFICEVDSSTLHSSFDSLRLEMLKRGYIPFLRKEAGEFVVHVQRKPAARYKGTHVNAALLLITILTTMFAGMIHWASYARIGLFSGNAILYGTFFFAFPLLLILGTHEMGHYLMARKHKVAASLPFFIPSIPPLGTFGAVISMREPIPDKRALLDIGIAGPLSGLAITIPLALLGLWLTNLGAKTVTVAEQGGAILVSFPLLYEVLGLFIPIEAGVALHPLAFASWVGFFVTALNLLPAGQLDGGHVARALLGENARYLSYAAIAALFVFSLFYVGWAIIAILIVFLGVRHPPPLNDFTPLDVKRRFVGGFTVFVLLITFVLIPIQEIPAEYDFEFRNYEIPTEPIFIDNTTTSMLDCTIVATGRNCTYNFVINNTGNMHLSITLEVSVAWSEMQAWLSFPDFPKISPNSTVTIVVNASSNLTGNLTLFFPSDPAPHGNYQTQIVGTVNDAPVEKERRLELWVEIDT
ncbi:MAG: site-2 protease family protein [Thermoplasmata archaeon]